MKNIFKTGKGSPWWVALLALLELIFGFVMLWFPFLLGNAAVWVGGFFVIALAFMRMIEGIRMTHHKLWNFVTALLYAILGCCMITWTEVSLAGWTLFCGLTLLVAGVFRFAMAIMLRESPGCAWRFFNALITLILGALVTFGWPESSIWFLGTVIAVEMIFSGWTLLFVALTPDPTARRHTT